MARQILVLGGTGMLGQPVVRHLSDAGHTVRVLTRSVTKAHGMFGNGVEVVEGSAADRSDIEAALVGCDAVHINLTQEAELDAMKHVVDAAAGSLERIGYVSATTACEENRWFGLIDVKMRCETILRNSGVPHVILCPTWVMETLQNFVHGDRAIVICGKKPPGLHFFAGRDFGRMVAASYGDERALGKRLFIHGPEGITLPDATERFFAACHPNLKVMRLKLWQSRLIAKLTRRKSMRLVTQLIEYFDKVSELGDPAEANAYFGAPTTTLEEWFKMPKDGRRGLPH